jgi:hypothetical protein
MHIEIMAEEKSSFYGAILLILLGVMLFGLFASEPSATGFAVREGHNDFYNVQTYEGDTRTCADGSLYGECSTLIKPKYCVYGALVDYCSLCGCDAGEVCRDNECI